MGAAATSGSQVAADLVAACHHCPDCERPPRHRLVIGRSSGHFCEPCLVALYDYLTIEVAHGNIDKKILARVQRFVGPIAARVADRTVTDDQPHIEQLRADHIYGWGEQRGNVGRPASKVPPVAYYAARELYMERGGGRSPQADFGLYHVATSLGWDVAFGWRVSVVATTGDVYAVGITTVAPPVLLLGSVLPGWRFEDANARFHGWADEPSRDLAWFRDRCSSPHPVRFPALPWPVPLLF